MSKTKELFMRLREDQSQFEADIREQEQEYFLSLKINNLNQKQNEHKC